MRPDIDWQNIQTPRKLGGCSEHLFSVNGDVGLPGCFCTVLAEEGCHTLGCVKGQSRLSRPSYNFIYFRLQGCHDCVLIAGTAGYQQIISLGTHKGIVLGYGQITYEDCEKDGGKDGDLEQTSLESSRGVCGAVHSHSG